MNTGILIVSVLVTMIPILGGSQIDYGNALNVPNMTNTNNTDVNGSGGNATVPDTQTGSVTENHERGNIVSLPDKCLGSALCPD